MQELVWEFKFVTGDTVKFRIKTTGQGQLKTPTRPFDHNVLPYRQAVNADE